MIRLRGARLVTPEGVRDGQAVTLADGRIVEIAADHAASASDVECAGGWLVPGFVDTHVHGVGGVDVLAGGEAVARVASLLPRYGVTAFLPTSVACPPDVLATFLAAVGRATAFDGESGARVLGAHLESNFIAPGPCPASRSRTRARSPAPRFSPPSTRTRRRCASSPWRRNCRTRWISSPAWPPPATACRSGIPARPTKRAGPVSMPAPGTRRTSSTACRRSRTGHRAWPAPCSAPLR